MAGERDERISTFTPRILDCRFDLTNPEDGRRRYAGGHILNAVYLHLDGDLCAPITVHGGRHPLLPFPCRRNSFRRQRLLFALLHQPFEFFLQLFDFLAVAGPVALALRTHGVFVILHRGAGEIAHVTHDRSRR